MDAADLRKQFLTTKNEGTSTIQKIDEKLKHFKNAGPSPKLPIQRPRSSSLTGTSHIPIPGKALSKGTSCETICQSEKMQKKGTSGFSSPQPRTTPFLYKPLSPMVRPKLTATQELTTPDKPASKNSITGISDSNYNMNHNYRGRAAIFLHKHFSDNLETREGAEIDVQRLQKVLPRLGFAPNDISVYTDFKLTQIIDTLQALSEEDYEKRDCVMIFVLTHGEQNDKIYAKDTDYSVDKIWKPFIGENCKGLTGKPKIFFIVACRGDNTDAGVKVRRDRRPSTTTDAAQIIAKQSYTIPSHADMLTVYSTMPGFYSYRENSRGTWYIEALSQELANIQPMTEINFTEFLTTVNRKLSISYTTYHQENFRLHQKKQCSSYTSTLTRTIYITVQ